MHHTLLARVALHSRIWLAGNISMLEMSKDYNSSSCSVLKAEPWQLIFEKMALWKTCLKPDAQGTLTLRLTPHIWRARSTLLLLSLATKHLWRLRSWSTKTTWLGLRNDWWLIALLKALKEPIFSISCYEWWGSYIHFWLETFWSFLMIDFCFRICLYQAGTKIPSFFYTVF